MDLTPCGIYNFHHVGVNINTQNSHDVHIMLLLVLTSTGENKIDVTFQQTMYFKTFFKYLFNVKKFNKYFKNIL